MVPFHHLITRVRKFFLLGRVVFRGRLTVFLYFSTVHLKRNINVIARHDQPSPAFPHRDCFATDIVEFGKI
jgi:hypothetical protein